jgi:hypothetical protein
MATLYCARISIGGNRATFVAWLLPEPVVQSVRAATSTVDGAGELAPSFFLLPLRAPHRHEPIQTEKPHADRKCLRIPARVAIGPTVLIETSSSSGGWPPQALVEPGRAHRGDRGARGVGMGDVEEKVAAFRDDERGDAENRRSMGANRASLKATASAGTASTRSDRQLIEINRDQHIIRGQQAPVEVEMNPHLERRERRRFKKDDSAARRRRRPTRLSRASG